MFQSNIKDFPCRRGKVRDVYDIGNDRLVIVSTDRISAFDYVLPNTIPNKGRVLTALTEFWLSILGSTRNHLISTDVDDMPKPFWDKEFVGRTMLVRKYNVLPVECIVRGYLSGSGWKEYVKTGQICGIRLPKHLQENMAFAEPLFTPSTKAEKGHDENITYDEMIDVIDGVKWVAEDEGRIFARKLEQASKEIYTQAHRFAWERGVIIADTKFEWGVDLKSGQIVLIDEVLTSDSSRYWPMASYCLGRSPESLDKQYVRDYLNNCGWDKNSEPPELPQEVVKNTEAKYVELYERLTGKKL